MNSPKIVSVVGNINSDSLSLIRGLGRYVKGFVDAITDGNQFKVASAYDQLIDYSVNPFYNPIGSPQVSIFLQKSKRRIAIIHDVIPLQFPKHFPVGIKGFLFRKLNETFIKFYDHIVTDSKASAVSIQEYLGVPEKKMSVIYPFSPLQRNLVQSTPALLPVGVRPKGYFLYVGDVNWHKNITTTAKAAVKSNQVLVCVGGAFMKKNIPHPWLHELNDFMAIAKKYTGNIILTGYVNDNVLASLYENAIANILISREEGFGYSIVEAGSFGTPSIVSDKPIFHEITSDKGAIFVDAEETDSVAKEMQKIAQSMSTRDQLGQEAYDRSLFFSKLKFQKTWQQVLESL